LEASSFEYGDVEDVVDEERADREWRGDGDFEEALSAVVPGAQPFRMMGKGLPGRGSRRLADRE
jgi:hypothetical protein